MRDMERSPCEIVCVNTHYHRLLGFPCFAYYGALALLLLRFVISVAYSMSESSIHNREASRNKNRVEGCESKRHLPGSIFPRLHLSIKSSARAQKSLPPVPPTFQSSTQRFGRGRRNIITKRGSASVDWCTVACARKSRSRSCWPTREASLRSWSPRQRLCRDRAAHGGTDGRTGPPMQWQQSLPISSLYILTYMVDAGLCFDGK